MVTVNLCDVAFYLRTNRVNVLELILLCFPSNYNSDYSVKITLVFDGAELK